MVREPRVAIAHDVWMAPDSLLERLMRARIDKGDDCAGQQPSSPGASRTSARASSSTATAPDGVIEAVEDPSHRFCLGVQWHPENFYRTGRVQAAVRGLRRGVQDLTIDLRQLPLS